MRRLGSLVTRILLLPNVQARLLDLDPDPFGPRSRKTNEAQRVSRRCPSQSDRAQQTSVMYQLFRIVVDG